VGKDGQLQPASLAEWRTTSLGSITERLEMAAVFDLAGDVDGKSVLDVGAGDGTYSLEAVRRGARATAFDRSLEMVEALRTRARSSHLAVTPVVGDAGSLPFADETFDVVMAITSLCFVADSRQAVREMVRVLRGGGRLVVGELGRWNLWALERRIQAWLGSALWQQARFQSLGGLHRQLAFGSMRSEAKRSAIFYPPCGLAARLMGRFDTRLESLLRPFGAFLVVSASKDATVRDG
jgi:SAM-dependent methyltransferase